MNDLTPIKTVIIKALTEAQEKHGVYCGEDELGWPVYYIKTQRANEDDLRHEHLATAIHDHFLNREKVAQAIREAVNGSMKVGRGGWCDIGFSTDTDCGWDTEDLINRLIASLAGGSQ